MQNRFVLSGIPSFVPTLSQSIHSIRDVVEENSCWVDRIAFLPTTTTTTANTVECCIELHLENVRDCAIASLNDQILVMNRIDGTLVEEKNVKKKKNNKKKNIIWFQIKAYPSTIEQSERLLELCPTLENDNCDKDNDDIHEIDSQKSKPLIQTVSFPHGIHLTISRTTTTTNGIMERQCGGTGAEAWRGGYLLALHISFWLSSSSSSTHDAPINNQQQYQREVSKSDWWWLQLFHSKTNVLELGAGLAGLPSMILAKAKEMMNNLSSHSTIMKHDFPKTITASDGVDEIVSLLKYNVHYNQLGSFLNVQHLDWNYIHNGTDRNSPNHDDNTNIERYDTILFADCIYTDRGAKLLARAIRTLIVPGGNVIGVLPDFRVGLNLFHNQMIQNGFSPTKLEMKNDDKEDGYSSKLICSGNSGKHYTMFWWCDFKNI